MFIREITFQVPTSHVKSGMWNFYKDYAWAIILQIVSLVYINPVYISPVDIFLALTEILPCN